MSFLQRRLNEQAKKEAEDRANLNAATSGFVEDPEEEAAILAAANAAPATPAAPKQFQAAAPKLETSEQLAAKIPSKSRTSPKIAQLRKQFRPKLLATIDEAD